MHARAHSPSRSKLYGLLACVVALLGYTLFLYFRRLFLRRHPRPVVTTMAVPNIDLAVVFKAASASTVKAKIRADAQEAEQQYTRLLSVLKNGGLYAVGRRGASQGQLIVLVSCPQEKISSLVQRERHSDFLYGLSTTNLSSVADTSVASNLAPADRLRLIHDYVTSTTKEGGLGIITGLPEWNRVESVMVLQDHQFNQEWIRTWSTRRVGLKDLDKIRDHFGESVAMYFSFLSAYSYSLVFPAGLGALTYAFGTPYSSVYSIGVVLWAITFTEWWRIHERILSVRWRTRGSFRVERNRAQFDEAVPRWRRDLRATAGVPVILLFAAILGALMTAIFVFEAFITQLYTGPGHQHVGLAPTILFMALVPRLMGLYQKAAIKLTHWEDHAHQSTHEASLTLKTFSLSAVVAYLGLILSAFVYVPFGGDVMARVQTFLFHHTEHPVAAGTHQAAKGYATIAATVLNTTAMNATGPASDGHKPLNRGLWEADALNARARLNPARLQDQMFAFMVTNQAINIFLEVGLPFVLRGFGKLQGKAAKAKNKRVAFEDEKADAASPEAKQERELLERIRAEVALPEYALYLDYAEMATQFGYVALWSTIWPLAPVMSWLNNILELRSDAYKITVHQRRPVPVRSDTIGPWLEALQTLAWVAALTNGALVFLFRPEAPDVPRSTTLNPEHEYAAHALGRAPQTTRELLAGAFALALLASHGALFARALIRHVLERALWSGHEEAVNADRADKEARENYLQSLGVNADAAKSQAIVAPTPADGSFWAADEGFDEIRRNLKDA